MESAQESNLPMISMGLTLSSGQKRGLKSKAKFARCQTGTRIEGPRALATRRPRVFGIDH
jgi:hypothetical protein